MDGSPDNWDETSLTYREGKNSVTVSGVNADQIELIFAYYDTDSLAVFETLFFAAAFEPFSSRTIFDTKPAGYLASL